MASCSDKRKRPPQSELPTSSTPTGHDPLGPAISVTSPGCAGQKRVNEETAESGDQLQHVSAPSTSNEEIGDCGPQTPPIYDPSPDYAEQEQAMEGSSIPCDQLQPVPSSLGATVTNEEIDIDIVQHSAHGVSSPSSGYAGREQGADEVFGVDERPQDVLSGSIAVNEEVVISAIRATDVALGLRRLPAGFYIVLHHNGLEWRTENKRSLVNNDVVKWSGPIPISSDLSAIVRLEVYASFEFEPMLGDGEQLRMLTVTVEQLLDHSGRDAPFTLLPEDGDVVSPCSSISVAVKRQKWETNDALGSSVVGPHWSTPEPRGEIEDAINRGHRALTRYRKHGGKRNLEHSVQQFEHALNKCLQGDPRRAAIKSNMGMAKLILSLVEGADVLLEAALWLYRDALAARPVGHPDRPLTLIQLASVHAARFKRARNPIDGANAEGLLQEAIDLSGAASYEKQAATVMLQLCAGRGEGHVESDGQSSVEQDSTGGLTDEDPWNLSVWLVERYERFGDLGSLQQAITILKGLLRSMPIWDSKYWVVLGNLGAALLSRFLRLGQLSDLKDAISTLREAVYLSPDGHPDKPGRLSNLGTALETRFSRLGELSDLENAISTQREAVRLCPDGHPRKPGYLISLGNSLQTRFLHLGELVDLEDAISRKRDAVHLSPDGHPHKPMYLNNLGNSLGSRFSRLGELSDLEAAILRKKEAVRLSPNSPQKPAYLNNLGNSLLTRFSRLGELSDLEDAISTQREAVRLSPDGHPRKPGRLNSLGNSLQTRFSRLGELSDLENAISGMKEAVHLSPDGHPHKPMYLNNLSNSLQTRFLHLGELSDLEDAVLRMREAVHLSPDGHPYMPAYLNNLSNSLEYRFSRLGELSDLEDLISIQREAVRLSPDSHPDKPGRLNNLGSSLRTRFSHLGELRDLEGAISRKIDAVRLIPCDHPQKPVIMNSLALTFFIRFLHLGQLRDVDHALSLSSHAASIPVGPPSVRFFAARLWIQCARLIRHPSLLHSYSVALSLLPKLAWIGLSLSHRYDQLIRSAHIAREAAAAALEAGFPETALEWLEQGRSVVWGELFQLRSSYDQLSSVHPDHARRLQALFTQLDQASAAHERLLSALSEPSQGAEHLPPESLQQVADRHRALAIERDKLLQKIRRLPGFERFLLHKPFSHLRAAAHSGPVVILNAAETRCDALIVLAGVDRVIHVPLPNFSLERCNSVQNTMKHFVRHARDGKPAPLGINWDHVLSPLWKCVVKPVLDALAFSVAPTELSRIFWCPTGPLAFLPIHAAGFHNQQYSEHGHKVFDFVVSSYVPSLATLIPSLGAPAVPSGDLRLLAVRQPVSDGQQPLPGVATELNYIRDVIERFPSAQAILVESSSSTVEEVLQLMKGSDWVHFACHGIQAGVNSGLCLADGRRLKVRDIVAVSRPRGGLAFLSACQTAMGEKQLSDEAIHIAAGMLFAGYGGVIGSMWSISDFVAPRVARDVYTQLLKKGARPDYREAARALQETTGRLRNQGVSFEEWIPFIHVGL